MFLNKNNYVTSEKNKLADNNILEVKNLEVSFRNKLGLVRAVRGVDFSIRRGQIVGLVGESGSGKSVSVKAIIGFNDDAIIDADSINLNGIDILSLKKSQWPYIRGTKIAYIPQDPLMSLNPTKKIASQIIEAIKITEYRKYQDNLYILENQEPKLLTNEKNKKKILLKEYYKQKTNKKAMTEKMQEVLEFIGITDYKKTVNSYPHEFSGGMRQRIVIAITIVGEPDVIIADEPTTALDVTIQAKVLDLIKKLSIKYSAAVIFISHDISLIANFCNYIYIMYAGMIVERGKVRDIFTNPVHPYTWALIASTPDPDSEDELLFIPGTPPNMVSPPKGDAFAIRNIYAREIDFRKQPPMFKVNETHSAATWLLHPDALPYEIPDNVKEKLKLAKYSLRKKAEQGQ